MNLEDVVISFSVRDQKWRCAVADSRTPLVIKQCHCKLKIDEPKVISNSYIVISNGFIQL